VISFCKYRILKEWIRIKVKFKLKTLLAANPVPPDVLEVLKSFLIPLLDLEIYVPDLLTASKRVAYVKMDIEQQVRVQSIRSSPK